MIRILCSSIDCMEFGCVSKLCSLIFSEENPRRITI